MKSDFWSAHYRCTQLHHINCKERLWGFVLYFILGVFLSLLDFSVQVFAASEIQIYALMFWGMGFFLIGTEFL